jgi:hypothetical protein
MGLKSGAPVNGYQVFLGFFGGFEAPKNPEKTIHIKNQKKQIPIKKKCSKPVWAIVKI